ncbi:M20 family metallopeptidase [Microbacterium sp.]|uniref:M20 family metallopeptidase n=1 Tax=Microbacterium sp. TaxID=51671 RepID=UPI003F71C384
MSGIDALDLARRLVRIDTAGGGEEEAIDVVADILAAAGFTLTRVPWQPGRPNLVAHWRGGGPTTLAAHLDTVPFDAASWSVDPLGGEVVDGRLYGRGSSDMKAGAAAMISAAVDAAQLDAAPFTVIFTSAEETGCHGARAIAASGLLHPAPVLIVGEATGNEVRFGHKGATWLDLTVRGRSAHGSRPELGVNAVTRAAEAILALRDLDEVPPHPALGGLTTNVGTITGGQQTNLVPDLASITVDVRTVPGQGPERVIDVLAATPGGRVSEILTVPSVWTDPQSELSRRIGRAAASVTGVEPRGEGVSYFTDGAVLADTSSPAVFIIGPGGIDQPHTSDESCAVADISDAVQIYRALLQD